MPYVKEDRREEMLRGARPENAGDLNYAITLLIVDHLSSNPIAYQVLNDIVAAIELVKDEFCRHVLKKYELVPGTPEQIAFDMTQLMSSLLDQGAVERLQRTPSAATPRELAAVFKACVYEYLKNHRDKEQAAMDILGALSNVLDEFRRRVQHPYEDKKIEENGDVYTQDILERAHAKPRRRPPK